MDAEQRELLRRRLATYLDRVPEEVSIIGRYADDVALDAVHFAWAGSTSPGERHYYRLQGPRLLVEWDNAQRNVNHAHAAWCDLEADFGLVAARLAGQAAFAHKRRVRARRGGRRGGDRRHPRAGQGNRARARLTSRLRRPGPAPGPTQVRKAQVYGLRGQAMTAGSASKPKHCASADVIRAHPCCSLGAR
jgi:hypothetical protein